MAVFFVSAREDNTIGSKEPGGRSLMRLGVCTSVDRADYVRECGFDYFEYGLRRMRETTIEQIREWRTHFDRIGLYPESYNGFFPSDLPIVGERRNLSDITDYADELLAKAHELGGQIAVLGSGDARRIPEGSDLKKAEDDFLILLDQLGNVARRHGIRIVLEPLRAVETNFINTVEEGWTLVHKLGHPQVGIMCDLFHMVENGEDLTVLRKTGADLWHVHVSNPLTRHCVGVQDDYDYSRFFHILKEVGYDSRISIEAIMPNFEQDARIGIQKLKEIFRP